MLKVKQLCYSAVINVSSTFTSIDIIYLLWHLSERFLVCHKFSRFHEERSKRDASVNLRVKERFIIGILKVENPLRLRGSCRDVATTFVSLFHGIRFRSLSYVTYVTTSSTRPIVGHMCLVSRSLLMLAHLTQRSYASRPV